MKRGDIYFIAERHSEKKPVRRAVFWKSEDVSLADGRTIPTYTFIMPSQSFPRGYIDEIGAKSCFLEFVDDKVHINSLNRIIRHYDSTNPEYVHMRELLLANNFEI